jgi:hypothetical protein
MNDLGYPYSYNFPGWNATLEVNSTVVLSIVPTPANGSQFTWANNLGATAIGASVTVTMNQNKTIYVREYGVSCM